jgi:excisionase family DNA binding protein
MNLEVAVGNRPIAYGFTRASEVSSLSKNTLRRKAKTGELRTVLVGRRRLIPFEALFALVNGSSGKT